MPHHTHQIAGLKGKGKEKKKKKKMASIAEEVGKKEALYIPDGKGRWFGHCGKQIQASSLVKQSGD